MKTYFLSVILTLSFVLEIRCTAVCDILSYGKMIIGIVPGAKFVGLTMSLVNSLECTGEDFAKKMNLVLEEKDRTFIKTTFQGLKSAHNQLIRWGDSADKSTYQAFSLDLSQMGPMFLFEGTYRVSQRLVLTFDFNS